MDDSSLPALFARSVKDVPLTGPTVYRNGTFDTAAETDVNTIRELRGGKTRTKALIIDSESLSTGRFNPALVASVKISGCDVWLAESISDYGDLTDAFLGSMRKLVIPVHHLRGISLKDVNEVSDSCIPLIAVAKGRPLTGKDLISEIDRAHSADFPNIIVMDYDGTADLESLRYASGEYHGLCVFSPARKVDFAPVSFEPIGPYTVC